MGRFDDMKKDWGKPPDKPDNPDQDFALMPSGVYTCELFNIEERQPKKGGEAFSVTLKVTSGAHEKRRVWDWINFHLPHSPKASEIGRESFRDLCFACGFNDGPPSELGELIGQELNVRIGTRAASGEYPAKNCVRAYMPFQVDSGNSSDDTADLF